MVGGTVRCGCGGERPLLRPVHPADRRAGGVCEVEAGERDSQQAFQGEGRIPRQGESDFFVPKRERI